MRADGCRVLLGSANWDARSLPLNFEFNLECDAVELSRRLEPWVEAKRTGARPAALEEINGTGRCSHCLRDGVARLLTPYL